MVGINQGMGTELQPVHIEEKNARDYEKEIMSLDQGTNFTYENINAIITDLHFLCT